MEFLLTEEQKMIRDMARDFAQKEVKPLAAELDKTKRHPTEIVNKMAELSLLGIYFPEEYGGGGADVVSYALAIEEVSAACGSTGVIMSAHTSLACDPIYNYGSEAQKQKYLTPMASGKVLGCYGLTESQAGSDAANQKTTAVKDGDHYIINGKKVFITNGNVAGYCVLAAVTDKSKGYKGISSFIVDLQETEGFSLGKVEEKLGIRASGTAELLFENARIPAENLLGGEGKGFYHMLNTLDGGRIGIGAQALGIGRAAFEDAVRYSQEREQFGKPVADLQAIQWMIADMAVDLDAARLMIYRAASLKDRKERYEKEAAMAKLFASEAAHRITHKALQIHGGYGYITEFPLERYYRDSRITEIYEGTSEIMRLVIAKNVYKGF